MYKIPYRTPSPINLASYSQQHPPPSPAYHLWELTPNLYNNTNSNNKNKSNKYLTDDGKQRTTASLKLRTITFSRHFTYETNRNYSPVTIPVTGTLQQGHYNSNSKDNNNGITDAVDGGNNTRSNSSKQQ